MRKHFISLLLVSFLCMGLLMGLVDSVQAQDPVSTSTPTAVATEFPFVLVSDTDIVTFDLLGQTEMELVGPFATMSFAFAMPPDWACLLYTSPSPRD